MSSKAPKLESATTFQRRFANFKKRKTAFYSLFILFTLIFMSFAAELIANNKPYFLIYNKSIYFPLFKQYQSSTFDFKDFRPDYRKICDKIDVFCLFPPVRYNPIEIVLEIDRYPSPPSLAHPMGLDSLGRDIFARMLYGFRVSFIYACSVWILAFTIGTTIGACMGYFGGLFDIVFYRLMEIFFSIPYLIVLITLVSIFTPNILLLIIISAIFRWGYITRYIRAQFLSIRNLDFVMSARASGCTTTKVLFRHILPNALTPIITFSPFFIATQILSLSSLDFLGLGVIPPTPSWGELLHQGKEYFLSAWYLALFPALGLFITLALINFIGEGIRDAFDPRRY